MIPSAASQYNAAISMEVRKAFIFHGHLMQHRMTGSPQVHVMSCVCGNAISRFCVNMILSAPLIAQSGNHYIEPSPVNTVSGILTFLILQIR